MDDDPKNFARYLRSQLREVKPGTQALSFAEVTRRYADPELLIAALLEIALGAQYSGRERLRAIALILDRRDGRVPVALVDSREYTDPVLASLPDAKIAQLRALVDEIGDAPEADPPLLVQ